MAPPIAQIRPYQPSDEKPVKFTIGKAAMEGLAVANRRATFHPLTVSLWVALSCIMVQFLGWWPDANNGILRWLSPLPAFACCVVPVMAFIDWIDRPYFEGLTSDILRMPDIADIQQYYSRSPASGFFVLEYDGSVIGLVAIDASKDSQSDQRLVEKRADGKASKEKKGDFSSKGTSPIATIRHFCVDEPFRKAVVQDDLVAFVTRHAFSESKDVEEIQITTSPLLDYVPKSLRNYGFTMERLVRKVGVYGWEIQVMGLHRARWESDKERAST